ncbi:hypothetical protein RAA17_14750 [Komagataeibacter rhaeticus]|nr:hypothetical protein [Komagataeibacter rhaeticus]
MGAICNGMASYRLRPYAATFLVFMDYMKTPIRLAAMMGLPVIYILTHDSIGMGEDGPTHQPVEHLLQLRGIPNLLTIRPADANEVAVAWQVAMESSTRPVAFALSRQALPTIDRSRYGAADGLRRGGYVVADMPDPQLILIATGVNCTLPSMPMKSSGPKAWPRVSSHCHAGNCLKNSPNPTGSPSCHRK